MRGPILQTKLYPPPFQPQAVQRVRLMNRLNKGMFGQRHNLSEGCFVRKLTLLSAPAGFGKTTLVSEWMSTCGCSAAWLSLDEDDNDPARFLAYLIAALQTVVPDVGAGTLSALQSPQLPSTELMLTSLINDIAGARSPVLLVLDDYHVIDASPVDEALTFLIDHLPAQAHLIVVTREDPRLSLARYRARGQLTELRVADLRFTLDEAAEFLNHTMDLHLSPDDIGALEARTEGWIAGLQLAALALQGTVSAPGEHDTAGFIASFTGSHRFVLDYLIEEVLHQQPEDVQRFLLQTSILDRLCHSLCETVVSSPEVHAQETLEYLERANLFIIPLDHERRWYRYHHLFAGFLRQRLAAAAAETGEDTAEFHLRASRWYEARNLDIEAFHHAAAANDPERTEHLIETHDILRHYPGAVVSVLNWLSSLPERVLDTRPALRIMFASALTIAGEFTGVEPTLQAAEETLSRMELDDANRDLIGRIAAIRATLATRTNQVERILAQSRRALEYLHPDNVRFRASTTWVLGYASQIQGDFTAARRAYAEATANSEKLGDAVIAMMALTGLGQIQESEIRLSLAAGNYRRVLELAGDPPGPIACEAHLGLARIAYEGNDLDAARRHTQQAFLLGRQVEHLNTPVVAEILLARLKCVCGDWSGAAAAFDGAAESARKQNFTSLLPDITAARVQCLLRHNKPLTTLRLARSSDLPLISQARIHLAKSEPSAALTVLEAAQQQRDHAGQEDMRLRVMTLQALALQAQGEHERALCLLNDALVLAEPEGLVRLFVDEGPPMARLLSEAVAHDMMPDYIGKLLAAFDRKDTRDRKSFSSSATQSPQPLLEPLSEREIEVLTLVAQGLSNRDIGERLFLALDTVKSHNRKIFSKLDVKRRTEAVARARELGLL